MSAELKPIKLTESIEVTVKKPVIIPYESAERFNENIIRVIETVLKQCNKEDIIFTACATGIKDTIESITNKYELNFQNIGQIGESVRNIIVEGKPKSRVLKDGTIIISAGMLCPYTLCGDYIYRANNYMIHIQGLHEQGLCEDPDIRMFKILSFN